MSIFRCGEGQCRERGDEAEAEGLQQWETPRPQRERPWEANHPVPGEAPAQRRPSPFLKAPPPVTWEGQSVAWNSYHTLMLSSFCRRSSLSQVSERATRGSPWLCFVLEEPQSQRGACCWRRNFFSFLKRAPCLMITIWPKLQKEWDSGKDVNSFFFFAKVLISGLHSGTDRRGETPVVALFVVLVSENRAK